MTTPAQQPPNRGLTYEQALVTAAALQAAQSDSGNPAIVTATVSALANQLIAIRDNLSVWAYNTIASRWATVNPYDGNAVQAFTVDAAQTMQMAQTVVARTAGAVQQQQLTAMGITAPSTTPSDPVDVRRVDLTAKGVVARPDTTTIDYTDGRSRIVHLDEEATTVGIFNRPARTYRYLESKGVDIADVRAKALERMQRLVDDNLILAQRLAEAEVIAGAAGHDSGIIGLRRVIHPELSRTGTCGLCIVAADQIYRVRELMPIHGRCKCTVAAVLDEFDPADHLNKADIGAIYKAAGGKNAPELKRVRIRIDEHGEFGQVLAPAKSKPRKQYQAPYARRARQLARADKAFPNRPRQVI